MYKGIVLFILLLPLIDAAEVKRHRRVLNKEHIKKDIRRMMPEEEPELKLDDPDNVNFHFFKLHDYDNNRKLDGLELGASLIHTHEDGEVTGKRDITDEELAVIIKEALKAEDRNDDGYIDYYEFVTYQRELQANL